MPAIETRATEAAPGQLVVTLYGLYARDHRNWLPVSSIVRLMADLGVDGQAARSAISRLKRRGVIASSARDGAAGYALSSMSAELLAEGDARIFGRRRATVDDGWLLAVFSVPEVERDKRHLLRTTLSQLGFGTVAPGVWVAPGDLVAEARSSLQRRGLSTYVELFRADAVAGAELSAKVSRWWDLDAVSASYAHFATSFETDVALAPDTAAVPALAFAAYVPMLTAWRRLPYLDPGLPLELLPDRWNGSVAADLFATLDGVLRAPAREHAEAVIAGRVLAGSVVAGSASGAGSASRRS